MDNDRTLTIKGEGMARGQEVKIKEIPLNKIKLGLDEMELGVALHSLGDDLLQNKISFDSAPSVEEPADESDLH